MGNPFAARNVKGHGVTEGSELLAYCNASADAEDVGQTNGVKSVSERVGDQRCDREEPELHGHKPATLRAAAAAVSYMHQTQNWTNNASNRT